VPDHRECPQQAPNEPDPQEELILVGEKVGRATVRGIVLTMVGALVLVLLANLPASWYLRNYIWQYRIVGSKWETLQDLQTPVDTLVLGDSSCMMGVVPEVLGRRLGSTSLNLARHAAPVALEDSWMLDTYLRKFGPPRSVVLVYAFFSLREEFKPESLVSIPLPLGFWNRLNPPLTLSPAQQVQVAARKHLPIYYASSSVSRPVLTPWNAFRELEKVELQPDGFLASPANPESVDQTAAAHLEELQTGARWTLSDSNRRGLQALLGASHAHGFPVYIALGPVYEGLVQAPAFQTCWQDLHRDLAGMAASCPQAHLVTDQPMAFAREDMQDDVHLTRTSAPRYTEHLARQILAFRLRAVTRREGLGPRPWRPGRKPLGASPLNGMHPPGARVRDSGCVAGAGGGPQRGAVAQVEVQRVGTP